MTLATSPSPESGSDTTPAEIAALNAAIVATLDNLDEYRRVSFHLEQRLNEFQMRIHARTQTVEALQSRVRELGGEPAKTHSVLATAFAGILSMRQIFTRNRENDLIADAERGEFSLTNCLKRALNRNDFSDDTRECLRAALDGVSKRPPPDESLIPMYNPQTRPVLSGVATAAATN